MVATPKKTENDVEREVVRFLQRQGWIVDRVNVGLFYTNTRQPIRIGKPGQPDWRAKRRREYLEVEIKAPGEQPSKAQAEYLAAMRHLGIAATWCDSLQAFELWYWTQFGE